MTSIYSQLELPLPDFDDDRREIKPNEDKPTGNRLNSISPQDRAFHEWYRFVLSFPPHLVRDYLQDFGLDEQAMILDPFCGTGTTIVEAKLQGIRGIGLEANPFAKFASAVKIDWEIDPEALMAGARDIADCALNHLRAQGIDDNQPFDGQDVPLRDLDPDTRKILLKNSISPVPLHKTLVLLDCLKEHDNKRYYKHALLALGKALVFSISNLHFGPEVGVGKQKQDVPVVAAWLAEIRKMTHDLRLVAGQTYPDAVVHLADARGCRQVLKPNSIDAVITSPPYPNEKDYTRTTRLESVLLGFISNRAELRAFKQTLLRSNTRGVYKVDDDDKWVADHPEIQRIAESIEARRVALGKTSGFERLYSRVTRLYFGGMARHLAELRTVLRPGAQLAYVVGDQASYLRIMIRTGQLLADIAQSLGYELVRIDLFRTRFATATKKELREEVVVLRWPEHNG
jgi:DNA modification methylase